MKNPLAVSAVENLDICENCVSDAYLKEVMFELGRPDKCDNCGEVELVLNLTEISNIVEFAIETHYEVTADNPNFMQQMMLKDKESSYEWYREGEMTEDIANALIGFADDKYGQYIQLILSDRHADFEMAKMGVSTPFDDDHLYQEGHVYPGGMYREWRTFENIVHNESRYFSATAKAFLDKIFENFADLEDRAGESVIKIIGPETEPHKFYRGRYFFDEKEIVKAMSRPDKELGPAPAHLASANRMNARGISVFYGATTIEVALAEIRPPVGSTVVLGAFQPLRQMRILDLAKLETVVSYGSLLDPDYERKIHRSHFLKSLVKMMTKPANPNKTDSEYLTTQLIADYILNIPNLQIDGILYPSSQYTQGGENIVLFHRSSRVQAYIMPEGSKHNGATYSQYEEGFEFDPHVILWLPHDLAEREEKVRKRQEEITQMFGGSKPIEGYGDDDDGRGYIPVVHPPSLQISPEALSIHLIKQIDIEQDGHGVRWNSYTESAPESSESMV